MVDKMRKRSGREKTFSQESIALSEGIYLSGGFCGKRETRWTDFFVRAFFLFAIITGSLGGMLSAFDIAYEKGGFFIAALLVSLYCASLYLSPRWENAGYILLFGLVLYAGQGLQTYISSGFYGILNDISTAATSFFKTSAQISYAEQVENHSLAISVAMCYFALIGCSIANGLISHRIHCLPILLPSSFFLFKLRKRRTASGPAITFKNFLVKAKKPTPPYQNTQNSALIALNFFPISW